MKGCSPLSRKHKSCWLGSVVWTARWVYSVSAYWHDRLRGIAVKVSTSRAEDPGFESRLRRDFSGVESNQWLKNWHSSGFLARRPALQGLCWDWFARCQYTVTGWDGMFDLQLLSQCGSTYTCLSRSVPEIHSHVAGTISNQQTTTAYWHTCPCCFPILDRVSCSNHSQVT